MTLMTRITWTLGALLVYLVCSQVPLYGFNAAGGQDAFYLMRMILASNKGTLMELGISPIITSGMVMQLLVGAQILEVDMSNPIDRQLYNAANKLLGIVITIGSAVAYVLSGMYGPVSQLGATTAILLIAQLFFAGMIVLLLDDLLSKGYGLGGGINVFIVTNICESILWACFSPMTYNITGTNQFEGAVIAFFHLLLTESSKVRALKLAFLREGGLPNLMNVIATFFVFLAVSYVQGFSKKVLVIPGRHGNKEHHHPVKMFYTSNMPIILLSALIGNLYFFSQLLFKRYGANPLIKLLGVWAEDSNGRMRPTWGISYIVSPPDDLTDLFVRPFHALFYIAFMLTACGLFARLWITISGSGARDVMKQYEASGVTWKHYSDSKESGEREMERVEARLDKEINTAAMVGGMCVALLSIVADLLNAIGSGTGILMAVTIIYDLYEKIGREQGLADLMAGKDVAGKFDD
jgi:protein transport protein SEC61 subunit alpha